MGYVTLPTPPLLQIIILWNSEKPPPSRSKWPPMPVPLTVTDGRRKVRAGVSASYSSQTPTRTSELQRWHSSSLLVYLSPSVFLRLRFSNLLSRLPLFLPLRADLKSEMCVDHLCKCQLFSFCFLHLPFTVILPFCLSSDGKIYSDTLPSVTQHD